jgi:GTP cyclohydrolase I
MSGRDEPVDGDLVSSPAKIPVPEAVQEAVRTLIRWAGDDPDREGLLDTPLRVAAGVAGICAGLPGGPVASSQPDLRRSRRL